MGGMTVSTFSDLMPGLAANGPAAELGDAADLFVPLIGDWRMKTILTPRDGPREELHGFWSFRWGLGGRAVYDVIGFRKPEEPADGPHRTGLTVRFYDLGLRTWRQVWIGVPWGFICEFAVRADGSKILIDGAPSATERIRWTFESIAPTAF